MSICQSSKSVFHTFFFMLQDIDLIFVVSSRDTNGMTPISAQGPLGPRDDIGRGWYGMWYGFCHVLYALSYISTGELYYMNLFTGLPSVLLLSCFKSLKRTAQLLIQSTWVTLQFACCCFKNILFIIAFFCVFWIFYSCS